MRTFRICIVVCILFKLVGTAQERDTRKPYYPGANTYFPLIPGSYWVWQDSFYDEDAYSTAYEMTNGEAATAINKDSVVSLIETYDGYTAKIKSRLWYKEGKKLNAKYNTFFIKKDFSVTKVSGVIAKLFPSIGDTMNNSPWYFVFTKYADAESTIIVAEVKNNYRELYKKGIGKIGIADLDFSRSTSNLIEYRIGNGPIIKKHWLMQAPEKK